MADGILITDTDKKKSSKTLKYTILAALIIFIFLVIIFSGESDKTAMTPPKTIPTQTTNAHETKIAASEEASSVSVSQSMDAQNSENASIDEAMIKNTEQKSALIEYEAYIIKKGDCLTKIAKELYGASIYWTQILDKNREKITDPDTIYAGQTIMVPVLSKEQPQWDNVYLVETYVKAYKMYKELEKIELVKFMLSSGVKRIDPSLVKHYKQEISKYNKAYASPRSMLGNPSP